MLEDLLDPPVWQPVNQWRKHLELTLTILRTSNLNRGKNSLLHIIFSQHLNS